MPQLKLPLNIDELEGGEKIIRLDLHIEDLMGIKLGHFFRNVLTCPCIIFPYFNIL